MGEIPKCKQLQQQAASEFEAAHQGGTYVPTPKFDCLGACVASEAWRACKPDEVCGLARENRRMAASCIGARERLLILADLVGVVPLQDTAAMRVVKARVAGEPAIIGPGVKLHGHESLIVLAGPVGVGKTLAASWAVSRLRGMCVPSYEFTGIALDLDKLRNPSVLVVDQVGAENLGSSDWALGQFESVLDSRYSNMRLTILCANLSKAAFEGRYGPLIADRLAGDGVFVHLSGTSLRRVLVDSVVFEPVRPFVRTGGKPSTPSWRKAARDGHRGLRLGDRDDDGWDL